MRHWICGITILYPSVLWGCNVLRVRAGYFVQELLHVVPIKSRHICTVFQGLVFLAPEVGSLCRLLSIVLFNCLDTFSQVLCGDMRVFSELKDYCETWYHLLISRLLYQNPTVQPADLGYHVQVGRILLWFKKKKKIVFRFIILLQKAGKVTNLPVSENSKLCITIPSIDLDIFTLAFIVLTHLHCHRKAPICCSS